MKSKLDLKTGRYYVKFEFHRNPKSEKSYMYELKMAFFDNGKPEELIVTMENYKMMLEA